MDDNNDFTFNLSDLQNMPFFDFTKTFSDGINVENHVEDSPYENINLTCNYLDLESFVEQFKNTNEISLLSWNIQGLPGHFNQLKDLVDYFQTNKFIFDIVALQESHIITDTTLFSLPNYSQLISRQREHARGGDISYFINSWI